MTVNINMFCALMEHRILEDMYGNLIITIHESESRVIETKVFKESKKLKKLTSGVSHGTIFDFRERARDSVLLLKLP